MCLVYLDKGQPLTAPVVVVFHHFSMKDYEWKHTSFLAYFPKIKAFLHF